MGEQSEHVGLSHNFSIKAFARRNLIQIQEWKRVIAQLSAKKFTQGASLSYNKWATEV